MKKVAESIEDGPVCERCSSAGASAAAAFRQCRPTSKGARLGAGLTLSYGLTGLESGPTERYTPSIVFWCFALGWAAAKASRKWQRVVVSLLIAAAVRGFFGDVQREAFIVAGMLLLFWLTGIHAPRIVTASLGVVASASLFIYFTHCQVYPYLEVDYSLLVVICSLAVGLTYWRGSRRSMRRLNGLLRPKQRPSIRVPLG